MLKIKNALRNLWKDESAQGTSEYILVLVVVIAVALLFKEQILSIVKGKMDDIGSSIGKFKPQ